MAMDRHIAPDVAVVTHDCALDTNGAKWTKGFLQSQREGQLDGFIVHIGGNTKMDGNCWKRAQRHQEQHRSVCFMEHLDVLSWDENQQGFALQLCHIRPTQIWRQSRLMILMLLSSLSCWILPYFTTSACFKGFLTLDGLGT